MIPSTTPRAGLAPPAPLGDNGADPVHGREWNTEGNDLQYACTFALPIPRACSPSESSCDCAGGSAPPLCLSIGQQTRAKAYPSTRALRVVNALAR